MARGDSKAPKRIEPARKRKPAPLKLIRSEPARGNGICLVFDVAGEEHSWLLEQTSVTEMLALMLKGRMRKGRRIDLDEAEITIEPPVSAGDDPLLCVSIGPLEICVPVDRAAAKAIRADLDRPAKRMH